MGRQTMKRRNRWISQNTGVPAVGAMTCSDVSRFRIGGEMRTPATPKLTTFELMGASLGVALAIVSIIYLFARHGDKLGLGLQATARWSFLRFWLASVGSALATLFVPRFQALAHRGRDFGLAFASAHLGLVAWLLYSSATPFPRSPLIFFSVGVFWIYLLAFLSIRPVSAKLAPRIWRTVRT